MSTEVTKRPRLTARAAIAAWPERLAQVRAEPTDENLQRLCSLLDAVDAWVVQRWGQPFHRERRATLSNLRRDAAEANRWVRTAQQAAKADRGAKGAAERARRKEEAS